MSSAEKSLINNEPKTHFYWAKRLNPKEVYAENYNFLLHYDY